MRKKPRKKVKKNKSHKKTAKALTKFILECKKRKIPRKEIVIGERMAEEGCGGVCEEGFFLGF